MNSAGAYTVETFGHTGDPSIDGLLYGKKWAQSSITYAFPDSQDDFASNYLGTMPERFAETTARTQIMTTSILDRNDGNAFNDGFSIEGFTGLAVTRGDDETALIRVSMTEVITDILGETDAAAVAGLVSDSPYYRTRAGDVWLAQRTAHVSNDMNTNPIPGNTDYRVLLHEIGHTLGLKHGHMVQDGWPVSPADRMGLAYSVMPNTTAPGYTQTMAFDMPQSYMMDDIAALQQLYGANYGGGDTVYSWRPGDGNTYVDGGVAIEGSDDFVWATIWDGGGIDTYDFSAFSGDAQLSLRAGDYSSFTTKAFLFYDAPTSAWVYAPGNIANALRYRGDAASLIENVIAGSGNDTIAGNKADNILTGGDGADVFEFNRLLGTDRITDFEDGVDRLDFRPGYDAAEMIAGAIEVNGNTKIACGAGKVVLEDFLVAWLDVSDFVAG